jgi:hypothetical protein
MGEIAQVIVLDQFIFQLEARSALCLAVLRNFIAR